MNYGFIYETTNLVNGKKYIGSHIRLQDLEDPDDSWYLGSGLLIDKAIAKYGRDNFMRVILEECISECDLVEKETYYLERVDAATNPLYYNLTNSGYRRGIKGYHHTEDSLEKMRENNFVKNNGRTEESRKKQSDTLKKKNHQDILAVRAKDTVWVTDGKVNRRIKGYEVGAYLQAHGEWYEGFTSNRINVVYDATKRANMSEARKRFLATDAGKKFNHEILLKMNPKGKVWISREGERKLIYPRECEKYLSAGWKRGMNH